MSADSGQMPFSADSPPKGWSIGRLAPLVLFAWLLLDILLRFAPPEWLDLRPVLMAVRFPRLYAPFEPNLSLYAEEFTGEAALEGNTPTQEQRPPIRFSTDALGFRLNPVHVKNRRGGNLIVWRGASFTYGASLSDEETFPAQLSRITGLPVYNAGRFHLDFDGLPELDWLLPKLNPRPEIAIYLHLEHMELSGRPQEESKRIMGLEVPNPRESLKVRYAVRLAGTWRHLSPMAILSTRGFKAVSNDRFLPNPYRNNLQPMQLPDGSTLLIRKHELESATRVRNFKDIRSTADHLAWLKEQLHQRGMNVIVVLIPSRPTMYAPWLEQWKQNEAPAHDYLCQLERELSARTIVSVNGLEVLRSDAQNEIATGDLSFYRDDNHWTPRGVRQIAAAVAEALNEPSLQRLPKQQARVIQH
jgi:hypothetical protein